MNRELVVYRMQRSQEALSDAKMLFAESRLPATVNRAYYALFYAVSAVLLTANFSSAKHSGIRALFNREYVKTGLVSENVGRLYGEAFDFRQKGDYADFIQIDGQDVSCMLRDIEGALQEIHALTQSRIEADSD